MLYVESVTCVYESEVCMRGNVFKSMQSKMFYTLFYRNDTWPRFLIFVIIVFYATVFALFVISYVYIFSGAWVSNSVKDTVTAPDNFVAPLVTNVLETTEAEATPVPVSQTKVSINGNSVPIPKDGSIHKEVSTENGNASINVSMQSSGSTNAESTSSIDVSVSSSSNTVREIGQ
ncbi:MAG: hypothetical protein JWO99_801 [Candidatus Saccharibacteria bacterium]|nr:hypothetical protein [Candidatus Saccharibacteria bacterium]